MTAILQSLSDFVASPFRAGHPLARKIGIVLLLKLLVLVLLKAVFFGGEHDANVEEVARRLTQSAPVYERRTN